MPAQLVSGGPEFGFEALIAGVFGLFLGWYARHGDFLIVFDVIAWKVANVRSAPVVHSR